MFFGTKLIVYQRSFDDLLNLWCFYSITAPHYANHSILETHNEVASELLFSFSIVKYKVADERILANYIYI